MCNLSVFVVMGVAALNRCPEHGCNAGTCVRYTGHRVFLTLVYTFANTLAAGCAHFLVYVRFVH